MLTPQGLYAALVTNVSVNPKKGTEEPETIEVQFTLNELNQQVTRMYPAKMKGRSPLFRDAKSILRRGPSPEELEQGFDPDILKNKPCRVNIAHRLDHNGRPQSQTITVMAAEATPAVRVVMGTLSGGQLRVTFGWCGHLLPCLGACPPIAPSKFRTGRLTGRWISSSSSASSLLMNAKHEQLQRFAALAMTLPSAIVDNDVGIVGDDLGLPACGWRRVRFGRNFHELRTAINFYRGGTGFDGDWEL